MDYETIDWEAEAQRVARAFGLSEKCYFREQVPPATSSSRLYYHDLCWKDTKGGYEFPDGSGVIFICVYVKQIGVRYGFEREYGRANTSFLLNWKSKPIVRGNDAVLVPLLAKGLFHLGLLTAEVETMLNVSNHEKLEWAREYEERYGL